jgi:uncharacterized protein
VTAGCALLLFGKRPEPGRVKTRLARKIGDGAAARLADAFLRDAAARYAAIPGVVPVVAADPDPGDPYWKERFPEPWRLEPQGEGDLGARLARAFARELELHSRVAAVGSDHPGLPSGALERFLEEDNAVWPTRDGGYAAIILSRCPGALSVFHGIDWSTDRVLAQTLERARELAMALARYPVTSDVDEPTDLDALFEDLKGRRPGSPGFPRHSWGVLREIQP